MERTEYFNNTKPGEEQLNHTEDSRIRSILRRFRSTNQFGIRTGFTITINAADATKIDIGPGEGYTGGFFEQENLRGGDNSGERISTLTESASAVSGYSYTVQGLGLTDYTLSTKNYVSLVYTETSSSPLLERDYPFTSHNTVIEESFTTEVLTEANWNLLTSDQKETRVLICIVTAQGAGNALSLANVDQVVQPRTHPTIGNQPSTITGTSITGVSAGTLVGSGTLRFEASTSKLFWTAPGDAEGTGVTFTDSKTATLYSDSTSYYITVSVVFAGLPIADTSETITIESLYGREIPMASAVDQAHRDMVGSGLVTAANVHGITLADIPGGTVDLADLFHVNGISVDADSDQLECVINPADNDILLTTNNGGFKNSFLIDGNIYDLINGVAAGVDAAINFDVIPKPASADYMIYLDSEAGIQKVMIASYTPVDAADQSVLWSGNIEIIDIHNSSAGSGIITWDSSESTLTWQSPADAAAGTEVYAIPDLDVGAAGPEGYYKLYSNNGTDWIVVYCNGSTLGGDNSSTFTVTKDETSYSDESILKLCVVTWNATGDILYNLRDARRFATVDDREQSEEEHDETGAHTKVLRNQFRVAVDGSHGAAIAAKSGTALVVDATSGDYGIRATANNYGVSASARTGFGVAGFASLDDGVYGSASRYRGVYGRASTIGVWGNATDMTGVYGLAKTTGVYGVASSSIGVYGSAPTLGVLATGTSYAMVARADEAYAIQAIAGYDGINPSSANTAIYGSAKSVAVVGVAVSNTGIYGSAGVHSGVVGVAVETGVYGSAATTGVYGTAPNYGVYGKAATNYGVFGSAAAQYGVYGVAGVSYGVYADAPKAAVFATAETYGVWAKANVSNAFYGSADNIAAYLVANVASTVAWFDGGILRYDIATTNAGVGTSFVPIVINGDSHRLILYDPA